MNRRNTPTKARIWIYNIENGAWVRITLKDGGDALNFYIFEDTDEGFSSREAYYYMQDGHVVCEYHTSARDCDGRHTSFLESVCPLHMLQAVNDDPELPARPEWTQRGKARNYDQYAEAAGY